MPLEDSIHFRAILPPASASCVHTSRMTPFTPSNRRFWLAGAALGASVLWGAIVWLDAHNVALAATALEASRGTLTLSTARLEGADTVPPRTVPPRTVQLGLESRYTIQQRGHSLGRVRYNVTPPIGGTHDPVWLNCGVYRAPVRDENAVHSLEHGAVWITYRTGDLTQSARQALNALAANPRVLISPYPAQPAAVIATAWGVQLRLPSANIARLNAFIAAHRDRATAPEPNGPCVAGTGLPTHWSKGESK